MGHFMCSKGSLLNVFVLRRVFHAFSTRFTSWNKKFNIPAQTEAVAFKLKCLSPCRTENVCKYHLYCQLCQLGQTINKIEVSIDMWGVISLATHTSWVNPIMAFPRKLIRMFILSYESVTYLGHLCQLQAAAVGLSRIVVYGPIWNQPVCVL